MKKCFEIFGRQMKKQELMLIFIALTACLFSANAASEKNPLESTSPSFLQNGNFEKVKNDIPEGWGGRNFELVKKESGNSVLLKGSASGQAVLTNYITNRTLYQPEKPVEIQVRFQASGKGLLHCMFYRYSRKNGKSENLPATGVGKYEMTAEPRFYTGSFTIGVGENVALAFHANSEITIENVSVTLKE